MDEPMDDSMDETVAGSMDPMMSEQDLTALSEASGPAFDRVWPEVLIAHFEVDGIGIAPVLQLGLGQYYEAGIIEGVEDAADHPERPVHTRQDPPRQPELPPLHGRD